MESVFRSHTEGIPELPNYFDSGSVCIFIDDCNDLIRCAVTLEPDTSLPLYSQTLTNGECGKVTFFSLSLRAGNTNEQGAILEASIRHVNSVDSPSIFSSTFIQQLIRRQQITGNLVSTSLNELQAEETSIETEAGDIIIHAIKGRTIGSRENKASKRNLLRISALLDEHTDPRLVSNLLRTWGDCIDILASYPLGKRSTLSEEKINISLSRLSFTDDSLDTMIWLEDYTAAAAKSEMTFPQPDYSDLDLTAIAEAAKGDYDIFSAALAANALSAQRIYGKTGIMPPLGTQSLVETLQAIRLAAEL